MYRTEGEKIRGKISKYLRGQVYDIGCGDVKITPDARGFDGRPLGDVLQEGLSSFPAHLDHTADVVFSSHVLEHMEDDHMALSSWIRMLKPAGHLILYLPDSRHYTSENLEHMRNYTYEDFSMFLRRAFCGEGMNFKGERMRKYLEFVEGGMDVGEDRYSFYVVARAI